MSELDRNAKQTIRERAYYIWEREARPEGRAEDHWAGTRPTRSSDAAPISLRRRVRRFGLVNAAAR